VVLRWENNGFRNGFRGDLWEEKSGFIEGYWGFMEAE